MGELPEFMNGPVSLLDPMQTLLILRESGPRRVQPLLPRAIEPFIEGQIIFATQMPRQQKKKLPEHYTHQAKPKRSKINHRLTADFKQ